MAGSVVLSKSGSGLSPETILMSRHHAELALPLESLCTMVTVVAWVRESWPQLYRVRE